MSSRVSPLRSMSTSAADSATVDPSTVFAYDPWTAGSEHPNHQLSSVGSSSQLAAPSNGMKPKRLYMDLYHSNEPETPMRKIRGQSLSGDSGLVTPQSATRSFSTSSLPMHFTPLQSLPSPLDTPLATPMKNPMENPFDFFHDSKLNTDWNFEFDFHANSPPPHVHVSNLDDFEPTVARSTSASSFGSVSDEETIASRSMSTRSMSTTSMTSGKIGGVNPFYCPPPFLRSNSTSGEASVDTKDLTSLGAAEQTVHGEDAGVSPRGTDEGLQTSEKAPFGEPLSMSEQSGFDLMSFQPREMDNSGLAEPLHSNNPEMVRARSSSTTSWSSVGLDTADKPFPCESCPKRFRRMEHLRRHMKTHTRERPFACTVENCGRRFSRTDNLKAHILTHTKKSGRNIYVEGLAETQQIKPIRRRKRKSEADINISGHLTS